MQMVSLEFVWKAKQVSIHPVWPGMAKLFAQVEEDIHNTKSNDVFSPVSSLITFPKDVYLPL